MKLLYTTTALAEAAGITYRQADYWTSKGYLKPVPIEGKPTAGSGHARVYDSSQVEKARLMAEFIDLHRAHLIADALVRGSQAHVNGRLLGFVTIQGRERAS